MDSSFERWIVRSHIRPQAKLRLLCFPYAGGSASIYRPWGPLFPPEIEVAAVQLPGREARLRETPFAHLEPLVTALGSVLPSMFDRPVALFGHSMGALIAYEVARLFQQQNMPPVYLFVSGRPAPQTPATRALIHALPREAFLQELQTYNGTPQEILQHTELLDLLLPVLRADFAVNETYRYKPGPPLTVPIAVFGGLRDEHVSRSSLDGWQQHTTERFTVRMLNGDHFFLRTQPQAVIQAILQELLPLIRAS